MGSLAGANYAPRSIQRSVKPWPFVLNGLEASCHFTAFDNGREGWTVGFGNNEFPQETRLPFAGRRVAAGQAGTAKKSSGAALWGWAGRSCPVHHLRDQQNVRWPDQIEREREERASASRCRRPRRLGPYSRSFGRNTPSTTRRRACIT